ncbi:D-alanyl-D-alanine carboxypeptidase [Streptomyces chrestomyceticus]|uniref:D-alanyl-D-alanine carboxypeptidase n=1 Tax=Streptomyces chrestomyceticus TaxID=68185 RepID=UPI0036C139C8
MAGESPGKPEQKQSSGETAGSERDPRLAVFRETPAGEAKADEAGKADKSGTAGKADNGDKAAGAQGEGRDERLREAVAAWVATKDDDGAEDGSGEETGTGTDAEKETRAKAEAGDAPVTKASADAGVGAGAGDGEAAGSGAAAEGAAKESADKSVKASAKAPAKGKGTAGEPAEGTAADASKDAPKGASKDAGKAAPAGGAKEAGPKADAEGSAAGSAAKGSAGKGSGAKGSAVKGSAVKEEGASGAASEGASASVDQPTAIFKAPSLAEDGEAPADEATRVFSIAKQKGSGDADPAKADTGSGAGDSAKGGAKNGAKGGKPDAEATAPKSEKSAEGPAEKSAEKGDRKAAEKPTGKPAEKATEKSGAKTGPASDAKAGTKSEGKSDAGSASPVDQPTTAIKAVRPPGAAESDGERTSQFVALKSTDPQPIKSPRPVGGDKSGKAGKGGKQAAKDAAKTDDKPGTKPAAEPDVAPGTKWGAKAAATSGAATGTQPEAKSGAAEASATAAPAGTAAKSGATALPDSEQTRQQPLPPLDLLAQLTNTPPPPETPMRTIARRFKIWTPLVILLAIIFIVVQQVRPLPDPTLALGGKSAYTFAGDAFQMPWPGEGQAAARVVGVGDVGTYGPQKPVPTASVAKVMTAHLILKNHPLKPGQQGPKIKVDATAVKESGAEDESRVKVKEGQSFTEFQMLQMLLIPSGNNIARLLARWDSPQDEQAFIGKMNAEAKALGMANTTYTDSSGFKDSTKSTAVDQLKLAEVVMNNEVFRKIVAMPNAEVPGLDQRLENNNSSLLIRGAGVLGIKTGSSSPAGGALMWAARRTIDGKPHTIVGVTMDQHFKGLDPNAENSLNLVRERSYKMIRALQDAMTSADVVKKGDVVGYVDDGLGGRTPVVATKDSKAVGWPGFKAKFSIEGGRTPVPHEAKAGTVVGQLNIGSGPGRATVPVALQKDLAEPSFGAKLKRIA